MGINLKNHIQKVYTKITYPNLLLFITLTSILFTTTVLFNIDPLLNYLTITNYEFLNFNDDLFLKIPINGILALIAGTLSAILAIIFSLTIIVVENISEKYTPYILKEFISNNPISKHILYYFIFVIVSSLLLFLVNQMIVTILSFIYLILLIFGFVTCFILLIEYFYFMFSIIDPINFASILTEKINNNIKEDNKEEAEKLITTMGDIAIKSFERNEQNVAKEYVSKIYSIFLQSTSKINKLYYLHIILDSYQRILDYCIQNNRKERFKIIDVYAEIPLIFYSMNEFNKFDETVFSEYANYLNKLFYANKEIINKNDFELFKSEINSISNRFVYDPKELIKDMKIQLLLINFDLPQLYSDKEVISKQKSLNLLIDSLNNNFANIEKYKVILSDSDQFFASISKLLTIKNDIEKLEHVYIEFKNNLFKFYLDSNLYNIFLVVGAYSLFAQKERNLESSKYLRELWHHTNPDDADGIAINKVPVSSDIEFLCNMLFYGGGRNDFWYDRYYFDGYHGSKKYLYTYFILLLTHLLEKPNKDLNIHISKDMKKEELEYKYNFLNRFISEVEELAEYCDELIQESTKWVFLLPSIKQNDKSQPLAEQAIIEKSTEEQFKNTKQWLENKQIDFKDKIKIIETYLPCNKGKVKQCKEKILESYETHSEISKAVSFKEFDINIDKNIKFDQIGYRPLIPKDCFLEVSHVDCSILWSDYGSTVALGEINYFLEKILNNSSIKKTELIDVGNLVELYELIEITVDSLTNKGFNPSTIFLPLDYLNKFKRDGWDNESKFNGKFMNFDKLKLNESTTLDIIHSSDYKKFEEIIILDRDTCVWTFKPADEDNKRLHIKITEYAKDIQKVDLITKTLINLKFENTDAIKILAINAQF